MSANQEFADLISQNPKVLVLWDHTTPECVPHTLAMARLNHLTGTVGGGHVAVVTNDLSFFSFDYNCVLVRQDGKQLSAVDLLVNDHQQTAKDIRPHHNIGKMLRAGVFKDFQA